MSSYISQEAYVRTFQNCIINYAEAQEPRSMPNELGFRIAAGIAMTLSIPLSAIEFALRGVLRLLLETLNLAAYPFVMWCVDDATLRGFELANVFPLSRSLHFGAMDAAYTLRDSLCLAIDNLYVGHLWDREWANQGSGASLYVYFNPDAGAAE